VSDPGPSGPSCLTLVFVCSCCVDEVAAQHHNADCIIHYGRSCLSLPSKMPALYVYGQLPLTVEDCVTKFQLLFPNSESNIVVMYDTVYHYAAGRYCFNYIFNTFFFYDMFLFYPRKQSLVRGMLESVGWPVWLVVLWSDLLEYIMLQVCRANVFHISNMQLALNLSHENYKKCKHTRHIFELFDQRITALFHLEHSHIMSVHVQLFDVS